MSELLKRAWAEIDLSALDHNISIIKSKTDSIILAVVKADGYGHGAVRVAKRLEQNKIDHFGVATLDEAVELRENGIDGMILILGYSPVEMAEKMCEYKVTQTCFSYEYAKALNSQLEKIGKKLDVHIKVDTGMGRIGFADQNDSEMMTSVKQIKSVYDMQNLNAKGIYTHFAISELTDDDFTIKQFDRFIKIVDSLEEIGCTFEIKHCANSAAIMNYPQMHLDMVRPGIILYGLEPDGNTNSGNGFKPVMTFKASVAMVKNGTEDGTISYGRTCKSQSVKKYATITVGYADGLSTKMSNAGRVLIRGKFAPICGRVCMDQMVVDVADIQDVSMGDEAIIFGGDDKNRILAEEIAQLQGLINYEVVCEVGKRVPRISV